ncbi:MULTISPECIES: diacylglycerol/lipid kinase family protein [Sphingomonadales]|uniref:Diacylglycerol kinase n=2 Tax=Edaphosphingomonas TaxID=3423724 RepID=A0A2T4HLF7_9SPHN|nr:MULTISPECIES: acylglycerol kinase family protein [Sphingomonas]AGH48957.1 diacylglycerol kinase catalytic subunit [Sphingomonas sp. MM-1]MDX3884530.1 acylglycerol kinase family protein [Sphingomonas sp.]OHT21374.1 Diacylglycerol kinase catalytic domain protein [Sphingomonas haloaromaticamans]PTD16642.1 diacylglycerol kinase [Sphingomonas fennica]
MAVVALLSNPRSTGNRAILPRIRSFCAQHSEIFHYEVESIDQIGAALRTIARVKPQVLVINGGDGTVQAALTELHLGGHFGASPPPVAVLPNGKTNLIALDLGASGDPIVALERVLDIVRGGDLSDHIVPRELIALSDGGVRPVLGMFLGGAGLADSILFCRNKIYPLGLPNGFSHVLTALAVFLSLIFGIRAAFLPPRPAEVSVSLIRQGEIHGRFALLIVTTLHKLLLGSKTGGLGTSGLQLMMVEQRPLSLLRAMVAAAFGRLGKDRLAGVHLQRGDEIRIEGERSSVILDGELFQAEKGRPIVLTPTPPMPFLRLAA